MSVMPREDGLLEDAGPAAEPCLDPRVARLRELIDSGDFDVLSLDVFDTLMSRRVPRPADVFFLVADELRARRALWESSSRESFVRERVAAEERARLARPSREVNLAAIYAEFPAGYLRGLEPSQVAALELEVEKRLIEVVAPIGDLLSLARARGMKTALVSDTYFRAAQIRELTGIVVDHTIASCEHDRSKATGLHQVLLERTGAPPVRVLHAGDNLAADVEGPAALGIARFWLPKFPEPYDSLPDLELPDVLSRRSPLIVADDGGLTFLRGQAMFAASSAYERWGAGVLGPVVTGFCDWVAERCRDLGIAVALGLMREGRILTEVLALDEHAPETRECFVSRYSVRKAAIFTGSEAEVAGFVLRPTPQPAGRLLAQLGLAPDAAGCVPDATLGPREARSLVRRVCCVPALRRAIVESSAAARRGLLRHVDEILGGRRPRHVAIVDLGYRGTIQEALQRVFDHERWNVRTHGLYLVTGGEVHQTQSHGIAAEGWLAANGQPAAIAHTFVRSPEIVEQSLMADCGTTVGYDENGRPELGPFCVPEAQRREVAEVQRGVLLWARMWHARRATGAGPGALEELYRAICIRSVARPLDHELELFGHWRHDENFGSTSARSLIEAVDLDEWERSHLSAHQLASLPHARCYWPFGMAHAMSRAMGEAVAAIHLRAIDPSLLASGDGPRVLAFYWDTGEGFRPEEMRIEPYELNNRGRVWHRLTLRMNGGHLLRFGVTIGVKGEIVQLAGARVRARPRGGEARVVSHAHESIEKLGYRRLHGALYLVEDDPALIVIPAPDLERFRGDVELDLFFTVLRGT